MDIAGRGIYNPKDEIRMRTSTRGSSMDTRRQRLAEAAKALRHLDPYRKLERPYAADVLLVPPVVELDGERLRWSFGGKRGSPSWTARRVLPGTGMLMKFAELSDAPPADILAFAKKWGVLGVCRHDLP